MSATAGSGADKSIDERAKAAEKALSESDEVSLFDGV